MRRCDIDNFGKEDYPIPPSCLVSVYGLPGAVPTLHYSVPLEGVVDSVSLFIHRALRTHTPCKLLLLLLYGMGTNFKGIKFHILVKSSF